MKYLHIFLLDTVDMDCYSNASVVHTCNIGFASWSPPPPLPGQPVTGELTLLWLNSYKLIWSIYLLEFMYGPVPLSTASQCNIVAIAGIWRGASQAGLHSLLKLEQFFSIWQHSFPAVVIGIVSECEQLGMAPLQKQLFDLEWNNDIFTVKLLQLIIK